MNLQECKLSLSRFAMCWEYRRIKHLGLHTLEHLGLHSAAWHHIAVIFQTSCWNHWCEAIAKPCAIENWPDILAEWHLLRVARPAVMFSIGGSSSIRLKPKMVSDCKAMCYRKLANCSRRVTAIGDIHVAGKVLFVVFPRNEYSTPLTGSPISRRLPIRKTSMNFGTVIWQCWAE